MTTVSEPLAAAVPDAGDRKRWIALFVVCLAMLMNVLDASIVNVALPTIQRSLRMSQANLTWIVNAYLLTFGGFLLLFGRLGDLIGRKRVFLVGLVIFTVASIVCGAADSDGMLIAARFVQGAGGAASSSVILAIIVTEFPRPSERAKAMSAYIFVAVAGGAIGLLVGGVITQALSWHWIFFINVPIGVIAVFLGVALIEESEGIGLGDGIDVFGSLLVTAAMMVLIFGIVKASSDGWTSAVTLGFCALGLVMLGAFVALESHLKNPIIPLRIFKVRTLTISSIVRGLVVTGMFGTFFLGALYYEHVKHFGTLATGAAFLPMSVVVGFLSSGWTARLMRRFGAKQVLVPGQLAMLAGLIMISRFGTHTAYFPWGLIAFTVMGFGGGTAFTPLLTIAMSEVPPQDAGLGSGLINVSMQGSGALGVAILGTIAADHTKALRHAGRRAAEALTGGYQLAFTIAAACVLAGVVVAIFALPAPAREVPEANASDRDELALEAI